MNAHAPMKKLPSNIYLGIVALAVFLVGNIGFANLIPAAEAMTVATTSISANVVQIHITASSWADMIAPAGDCGTAPPLGSWGFALYNPGTTNIWELDSFSVYSKSVLDATESFDFSTFDGNGTYRIGLLIGSTAVSYAQLRDITSCNTIGDFTGSSGSTTYGPITIPSSNPGGGVTRRMIKGSGRTVTS